MRSTLVYWVAVLAVLTWLALALGGLPDPGRVELAGAGQWQVYLVVYASGLVIAAALRILAGRGPGTGRALAISAGVLVGIGLGYGGRAEFSDLYDRVRGNLMPSVALTRAQGEAELRRAWDGHYRAEAEVNGVPMRLMIDTGASMVLIPFENVAEIGIDPDSLEYSQPVTTANGKSTVAPIRISSIKVGPIAVFDVPAAVALPGRLRTGLLGMSFLDELTETSFKGDRLILRN